MSMKPETAEWIEPVNRQHQFVTDFLLMSVIRRSFTARVNQAEGR